MHSGSGRRIVKARIVLVVVGPPDGTSTAHGQTTALQGTRAYGQLRGNIMRDQHPCIKGFPGASLSVGEPEIIDGDGDGAPPGRRREPGTHTPHTGFVPQPRSSLKIFCPLQRAYFVLRRAPQGGPFGPKK
eukprot:scaffold8048_cov103-Isochrysis_galbana.AAC.1